MGVHEVSSILWRERELVARLRRGLEEEEDGPAPELELAAVRAELKLTDLLRAVEVHALTTAWGLPHDATLGQLADAAPPPWPGVLADHRNALAWLSRRRPPLALAPSISDFLGPDGPR